MSGVRCEGPLAVIMSAYTSSGATRAEMQRSQYHEICRAYNTARAEGPTSTRFIEASITLHAAKGGAYIPKYMTTAAYVKRCGTHLRDTP